MGQVKVEGEIAAGIDDVRKALQKHFGG